MKRRAMITLSLVISLSGASSALAHEHHEKAPSVNNLKANGQHDMSKMKKGDTMQGMDMSGGSTKDSKSTTTDSQKKSVDDMQGMDMSGGDMQGMDMSGDHDHKPVKETPPNMKVLGTFGSLNFIFIAMGIWTKYLRRKGVSDGNSK